MTGLENGDARSEKSQRVSSGSMATLRLFAGLRDHAGTARIELEGSTVDEVVGAAIDHFGPGFAASVPRARVWLNGEEAGGSEAVQASDEIALIPPVSGGAAPTPPTTVSTSVIVGASVVIAVVATHLFGSTAWFAAVAVGIVSMWVADVATVIGVRGRDLPIPPVLATMVAAVVATHLLGTAGLALTVVAAVVFPMAWAVASESSRMIQILAPTSLVAVLSGLATASVLLTEFQEGSQVPERSVSVLLLILIIGSVVGAVMSQLPNLPFGDPFTAVALAAVLVATVAAAIWDLELSTFLLIGVASAVGFIAGRAFGAVLRTRSTSLVERSPGLLTAIDGAVLTAALYFPLLRLLS